MGLKFWKAAEEKDVMSERLVNHLSWKFSLDEDTLRRLRFASKPGSIGVRKTTYIRVFDPVLLNGAQAIEGYDNLDSYQEAVLFEGRWHDNRVDDLVDVRSAS